MPKKKPPAPDEKPQKQRFVETARELGVDDDAFERAIKTITPPKKPKR